MAFIIAWIDSLSEEKQVQLWKDYKIFMFGVFTVVAQCTVLAVFVVMVVVPYALGVMERVKREGLELWDF
jgi:hypothetical protein